MSMNRLRLYKLFEELMSVTNLCFTYVGITLDKERIIDRRILEEYFSEIDHIYKQLDIEFSNESKS